MAAPPVKSQPLHNFSLPHLKWAHKNSSPSSSQHHRFRRRDSLDQHRQSYPDPECEPETRPTNPKQQPSTENDSFCAVVEEENGEAKPWKLRPRKENTKAASTGKKETGAASNDCKNHSNNNGVKSQRLRGLAEGGQQNVGGERKSKRKIWISLSREEIEEDVYALTGGKPARRPRKWPKNVQKQLDNVFPGLYLVGVAADSYRVMMLWRTWAIWKYTLVKVVDPNCRVRFDVNMEVWKQMDCCNCTLVEVIVSLHADECNPIQL